MPAWNGAGDGSSWPQGACATIGKFSWHLDALRSWLVVGLWLACARIEREGRGKVHCLLEDSGSPGVLLQKEGRQRQERT